MGKHVPLATGLEAVLDTIDDFAEVGGFGGSARGKLKERLEQRPLGIGKVGAIGFSGEGLVHGIAFVENSLGKATQFPQNVQDQLPILPKLRRALL